MTGWQDLRRSLTGARRASSRPVGRRRFAMGRRALLAGVVTGVVGCLGDETSDEAVPDLPEVSDPPDAVYVPSHREGMAHLPAVHGEELAITPMLSYPHRFFLVTGTEVEEVTPSAERGVHLMVTAWDHAVGRAIPIDVGAEIRILREGEVVETVAPWPMISQTMGVHFGDNVPLPGDDTYTVEVDLAPVPVERRGAYAGRLERPETLNFEFEYDEAFRADLIDGVAYLDEDTWGQRGALDPPEHEMEEQDHDHDHDEMTMPAFQLPAAEALPGTPIGTAESGDAHFVLTQVDDRVIVSPRTPYNRVPLAEMALSVAGAIEGPLLATLDDEIGLHYAIEAAVEPGDVFDLVVDTPPQIARHNGYETAFLEIPPMEVRVTE